MRIVFGVVCMGWSVGGLIVVVILVAGLFGYKIGGYYCGKCLIGCVIS